MSPLAALLGLALLAAAPNLAHAYPTKPITLVAPYPAGGRTDLTARTVAQFLRAEVGQPVVVVNKPGASGVLGAKEVAAASPDGHTLGVFSTGFLTTQYTVQAPTSVKDYELVALVNMDPAAIAATSQRGWKTLAEVVDYGRKNPGKLRVGTNPGSSAHIFAAAFVRAAGLDVIYVPFRGGGERTTALAGGHIDVDLDIVAPLKPMADAGKVRILAVASEGRVALYRGIPTMREEGVDLVISSWHGVFAPRGTPAPVVAALSGALEKVSRNPQFVEQMGRILLGVRYMGQPEFARFFSQEDGVLKVLIEKLGLFSAPAGLTR